MNCVLDIMATSIWIIGRVGIGDAMQEGQTHRRKNAKNTDVKKGMRRPGMRITDMRKKEMRTTEMRRTEMRRTEMRSTEMRRTEMRSTEMIHSGRTRTRTDRHRHGWTLVRHKLRFQAVVRPSQLVADKALLGTHKK